MAHWTTVLLLAAVLTAQQSAAQPVTIHAAGGGEPHLFLRDGRKLLTNYSEGTFGVSQARPLALASGDFDEDGMPDLASAYASGDGTGVITIHRGNVDALWPYGKATANGEPPAFLPDAQVFHLPAPPDFLAAGDFDADGHWDLVAATQGGKALYFLRGDGHGGFASTEQIPLPGAVTAFASGEINRVDGLTDLAVGIATAEGAEVLVFESPAGALRGAPEVIPVSQPVRALAMMPLDDDPLNDLAIGAGDQLVTVHGRDRRLSATKALRDGVAAARITSQTLQFRIHALAPGHFTSTILDLAALGDDGKVHFLERADADYQAVRLAAPSALNWKNGRPLFYVGGPPPLPRKPETAALVLRDELALPSATAAASRLVVAHTSITQTDDLIAVDGNAERLHVLSRTAGSRAMHLAASLDVSGAPAAVLPMRLSPSALRSLVVLHARQLEPSIVAGVTLNTFTVTTTADPGPSDAANDPTNTSVSGSLRWALSSALTATGPSIIQFNLPLTDSNYDPQTGAFTFTPIPTTGCLTNAFLTCYLLPVLAPAAIIDGYTQPGASPNSLNMGDNAVLKIVINGVNAPQIPLDGLDLLHGLNTVRGLVINGLTGQFSGGLLSQGVGINPIRGNNVIEGNFVGTDAAGANVVHVVTGIGGYGGPNIVGGTTSQARNLLSGATVSFAHTYPADPGSDYFQGNYVGTDRTGSNVLGGFEGINMSGINVVIGGTTAGAANLITGQPNGQISIISAAGGNYTPDSNIVQANLVGTDLTGAVGLGGGGVSIQSGNFNLLGGTTPAARNVIAGNLDDGVQVYNEAESTSVQGNYIGVDISGGKELPNSLNGVDLALIGGASNALGTLVGGETPGAGNVISGNGSWGIVGGGSGNSEGIPPATILGNFIGVDATGLNPMGNGSGGIDLFQGGSNYVIGGTDTTAGNLIASNQGPGVQIDSGVNNPFTIPVGFNFVTGNRIFSNTGPGVWAHSGNSNTISENSIYSNGGLGIDLDALGRLVNNSCPPATNGGNNLQPAPVLTASPGGSTLVSATATDPNGNTSEFSNCVAMSSTGNTLTMAGSLNGAANTNYIIEFFQNAVCDPSGYGQGKTFLNRVTVKTGATCAASLAGSVDVSKADLSVAIKTPLTTVYFAKTVAYTATVTNNAVASAANVSLADTLPAGLLFSSASATQGSCGNNGAVITCSLGTVPAGASVVVTINAIVNATGAIANTATVSSSTVDPNSANNSATANVSGYYQAVSLSYTNPAAGVAGSGALPLTIYGLTFYPNVTTVTANGASLTYTLGSGTIPCEISFTAQNCQAMNVTLPASLTASAGAITLKVVNPTPGGNTATLTFNVYVPTGNVNHFGLSCLPVPTAQNTSYNLTVSALDANGNVVTGYRGTVTLSDIFTDESFTPASPYTFTAADNGAHTFSTKFTLLGPETITVADRGTPSVMGTESVNIVPLIGAPKTIVFGVAPDPIPFGFPFPQPVTATIEDANSNGVPGVAVTYTITPGSSGASATFSNGTTSIQVVTNANGVASAPIFANQIAGSFTVKATSGALASQTMTLSSLSTAPAHISIVIGDPTTGPVNAQFAGNIGVMVTDASNNPVLEVPVVFSAPTSGASINLPITTALTAKQANFSVQPGFAGLGPPGVANSIPGNYLVTATVGSLSVQFHFTNTSTADVSAGLAPTGSNQFTSINTPFPAPLVVLPYDASGNCLAQVPITFTAPSSGASATFSATTVMSDPVTCTAQVTAAANGIGGPYTVTANAPSGVSTTFSLTNVAGSVILIASGGTPQSAAVGRQFGLPLHATLDDSHGNPMSCQLVNFTAPPSGASAILSSTQVLTDSTGLAQVNATANNTGGSYTVTASFGGMSVPFALSNVAAVPTSIATSGGTPQSTMVGTPFAIPLSATVRDNGQNPLAGITVTFLPPSTGASATLSSFTAVTNSQGVASVTATANGNVGNYYVGVVAGNLNDAFSLSNTAGAPAVLSPSGTPQSALPGTAFALPLQVTVEDADGNPLTGVAVSFTAPTSGATAALSAATAITNNFGVASVTAIANSTLGAYSVTAKAGALSTTFSLTNSAFSPCDVNQDGKVNIKDVQLLINQVLGSQQAANDLNGDHRTNAVDTQIVLNAALNLGCVTAR